MKHYFTALFCGVVFGIGLILSGMINPAKILAFLNISGNWDPTLLIVMAVAVTTTAVFYKVAFLSGKPAFVEKFYLPEKRKIDGQLVTGALLFGIGWGITGFCPGPAIAAIGLGGLEQVLFLVTLIAGIFTARLIRPYLFEN